MVNFNCKIVSLRQTSGGNGTVKTKEVLKKKASFLHSCTYLLTYFMEQSPWKASSHSASQEIIRRFWNPKVHHRVRNSPPLVSILSQIHLVYTNKFPW